MHLKKNDLYEPQMNWYQLHDPLGHREVYGGGVIQVQKYGWGQFLQFFWIRYKLCNTYKCSQMFELDVLLHHLPLNVHLGHGDEIGSNEVIIHHIFEFCVKI